MAETNVFTRILFIQHCLDLNNLSRILNHYGDFVSEFCKCMMQHISSGGFSKYSAVFLHTKYYLFWGDCWPMIEDKLNNTEMIYGYKYSGNWLTQYTEISCWSWSRLRPQQQAICLPVGPSPRSGLAWDLSIDARPILLRIRLTHQGSILSQRDRESQSHFRVPVQAKLYVISKHIRQNIIQ